MKIKDGISVKSVVYVFIKDIWVIVNNGRLCCFRMEYKEEYGSIGRSWRIVFTEEDIMDSMLCLEMYSAMPSV